LTVVAHVQAKGGRENELIEISKRLVPLVRKEPGCLLFEAHHGWAVPGIVLFYEIFESQAGFEALKKADHTKLWFKEIGDLAAGPVEVTVLQAIK
jgi:quinol monooxygenase YgiN